MESLLREQTGTSEGGEGKGAIMIGFPLPKRRAALLCRQAGQ